MTDNPITPPPELVQQWASESLATQNLCNRAAQWGADQELEACCADIHTVHGKHCADWLRDLRRPKPPSLKEEALEALKEIGQVGSALVRSRSDTIRRALEQLDD